MQETSVLRCSHCRIHRYVALPLKGQNNSTAAAQLTLLLSVEGNSLTNGFGMRCALRRCMHQSFRLNHNKTQNGTLRPAPNSFAAPLFILFTIYNCLTLRLMIYRENPRKIPVRLKQRKITFKSFLSKPCRVIL